MKFIEPIDLDSRIARLDEMISEFEEKPIYRVCTELLETVKALRAAVEEARALRRSDPIHLVTEAHK